MPWVCCQGLMGLIFLLFVCGGRWHCSVTMTLSDYTVLCTQGTVNMPCPHGIGDCSRIHHLRTTSLFQLTERQKPFIVGGLDSERPPNPIDFPLATRTFFRVLSVAYMGGLGVAWAACRRRLAT